jgi:3-deoxy-manno-octulosonate cytidylyltransferase (CMP-KDO synthetase)
MNILGIIPARFGSTRFPGKALADIGGKSMVQRVWEQARKATSLTDVVVATDDARIYDHVAGLGGRVVMTSPHHQSGTDRCQEVMAQLDGTYRYVVNIQGDEPFIQPEQIDRLAAVLDGQTELATLVKPITDPALLTNPNVVKAVVSGGNVPESLAHALYFSRQPIPYQRDRPQADWLQHHTYLKHIGLYAYRTDILAQITQLVLSPLERAESLEQLRWLENGFRIRVVETDLETIGIDTPEDLRGVMNNVR